MRRNGETDDKTKTVCVQCTNWSYQWYCVDFIVICVRRAQFTTDTFAAFHIIYNIFECSIGGQTDNKIMNESFKLQIYNLILATMHEYHFACDKFRVMEMTIGRLLHVYGDSTTQWSFNLIDSQGRFGVHMYVCRIKWTWGYWHSFTIFNWSV